jgi:alanyl-tRNA synthetase
MEKISFGEEDIVKGSVDNKKRSVLRRHHTATHLINAAARQLLGLHIWQAGSEKTTEKARLDITHFEALTGEQIEKIEKNANEFVKKNILVKIEWLARGDAENKYGFRIYQGGAVPGKNLRIVSVPGVDVEACGGIHCNNTGDVGLITILNNERIQDGVVRLEYTSGENALKILREKEKIVAELKDMLKVPEEKIPETVEKLFEEWKAKTKEFEKLKEESGKKFAEKIQPEFKNRSGLRVLIKPLENLKSDELRELGTRLSGDNTALFLFGLSDKIYVFCKGSPESSKRGIDIGKLCREVCTLLGGGGGGSNAMGEGVGRFKKKIADAEKFLEGKL